MKIIVLTGMPGSGKGEIANYCKFISIPVVRMGDMVIEEVKARGLDVNSDTVGKVASEMREKEGYDIWARRTADYIEKYVTPRKPEFVIIDGVRNIEEIYHFRNRFGDSLKILAVHASPKTRHQRLIRRGRKDDGTLEDALERDKRELSWGIGTVIALADLMIINEGSLLDFRKGYEKAIEQLKAG